MDIAETKKIRLVDYLSSIGIHPIKVRGISHWYLSPFRKENTPSFKVNDNRNEWYDFGLGRGGDIIDLCKFLFNLTSVSDVLRELGCCHNLVPLAVTSNKPSCSPKVPPKTMCEIQLIPLSHPALISYLNLRRIDIKTAKAYCNEIHYKYMNKRYFGIAFQNRSSGFEIRNSLFKGCIHNKDISLLHYEKGAIQDECCIFEGFMDFLSYMTMLNVDKANLITCINPSDYVVLNSITNLNKCMDTIGLYAKVHCYLDNDAAGQEATASLKRQYHTKVVDESFRYASYKDLNDYLLACK